MSFKSLFKVDKEGGWPEKVWQASHVLLAGWIVRTIIGSLWLNDIADAGIGIE